MVYKIYDITGEFAVAANSGQDIYDLIYPQLVAEQAVELDFSGVTVFASAFFNFAIGQLLKDLAPAQLNQLLQITALNSNGQSILKCVIENAKNYYRDSQYKKAVDEVVNEYVASL